MPPSILNYYTNTTNRNDVARNQLALKNQALVTKNLYGASNWALPPLDRGEGSEEYGKLINSYYVGQNPNMTRGTALGYYPTSYLLENLVRPENPGAFSFNSMLGGNYQ